jgi:putative phosphoesterase
MKISILSDTHSKVKKAQEAIDKLIEDGAEFIVHAGDICELQTLELLKNCSKRYVVVYGNNDSHLMVFHDDYNLVQEPYYFKLDNTKFKLMHLPFYMAPDTEVVISGHTHKFHAELNNGTLFLNPGESCARNKPVSQCAMLEIQEKKFLVTHYTKAKDKKKFKTQEFSFKRGKKSE